MELVCHVTLLQPTPSLEARWLPDLSADERTRHQRFHHHADQIAFACAHGLLRHELTRVQPSLSPAEWHFRTGPHGKPSLERSDITFNLSHARDLVGVAIAGAQVGVDVETIDPSAITPELMRRVYAPQEIADIESQPLVSRAERFFTYWVLKESWVKATGVGLDDDLPRFCLEPLDNGTARVRSGDSREWTFAWWRATPNAMAAVCVAGPAVSVENHWYRAVPLET